MKRSIAGLLVGLGCVAFGSFASGDVTASAQTSGCYSYTSCPYESNYDDSNPFDDEWTTMFHGAGLISPAPPHETPQACLARCQTELTQTTSLCSQIGLNGNGGEGDPGGQLACLISANIQAASCRAKCNH